jgi:hypothetical protein
LTVGGGTKAFGGCGVFTRGGIGVVGTDTGGGFDLALGVGGDEGETFGGLAFGVGVGTNGVGAGLSFGGCGFGVDRVDGGFTGLGDGFGVGFGNEWDGTGTALVGGVSFCRGGDTGFGFGFIGVCLGGSFGPDSGGELLHPALVQSTGFLNADQQTLADLWCGKFPKQLFVSSTTRP